MTGLQEVSGSMAISGDQGRGSQGLVTELCGTEEVELPGAYTANGTSWGAGQMLPNHPPSLGSLTEGLRYLACQ